MTEDRKWGWRPDLPDGRDYIYDPKKQKNASNTVPNTIDLRTLGNLPDVYDQANTASCVGQAVAGAIEYNLKVIGNNVFTPSTLFIYYNARVREGTERFPSAGASLRNAVKGAAFLGAPPQDFWTFDVNRVVEKPEQSAFNQSNREVIKRYSRLPLDVATIKHAVGNKLAVVFGMSVYESFMSEAVTSTGVVPLPKNTEVLLGGHTMMLVGYDEKNFIFRNSWGNQWGEGGYGYVPYEYLTNSNLAEDFWVIETL